MTDYDDSYPTCAETYSSLRLLSRRITAAEITRRLESTPSSTHAAGDAVTKDGRGAREEHGWFLETRGVIESRDTRRHIDWLLDRIEQAARELAVLRNQGVRIDMLSYWVSAQGHGGPMLGSSQLERLAALELECGWDVYLGDEDSAG